MTFMRGDRRRHKARLLLSPAVEQKVSIWADLGCGDGIFTRLLAELLPLGSTVYAVDKNPAALRLLQCNLSGLETNVTVYPLCVDFTQPLDLPPLDGLLLANSLHFVRDKEMVLRNLVSLLRPGGRLVVIEYNTRRGNAVVPFPLHEDEFLDLAARVGLAQAEIRMRAPSTFMGEMYTGFAMRACPESRC